MKNKKSKVLAVISEILRFGPTLGVVAYYSQDFFQGSEIHLSASIIFIAIIIILRFKKMTEKIMDLPGGTGFALVMAVFSGICLIIGEEIFFVSATYLASIVATVPINMLNSLPEDTNEEAIVKALGDIKKELTK
jgi:hypothetical protein